MQSDKALFFLLAASLLFFSCAKKADIVLDNSDPLALAPDVQWALVNDPYAAFRSETSWNAEAVGYCKQGEYFPIMGISSVRGAQGSERWYSFEEGWLPESAVTVYPNKLRAAKAAAILLEK